jgi:hypothetical protein
VSPFAESPRAALRETFTRALRTGRPIRAADLEADGIPAALADLIAAESADLAGRDGAAQFDREGGVLAAVAIFAPAIAEALEVPDIADRYPVAGARANQHTTRPRRTTPDE